MTACGTGPPGKGSGPPVTAARLNAETPTKEPGGLSVGRWSGCPMGCGQYGHEPPCTVGRPLRLSCHACGALDIPARESLDTCRSVCPMQAVA